MATQVPTPADAIIIDIPIPHKGRWYRTARFWKRFSVTISIVLSAVSLIVSAIASLKPGSKDNLRALTLTNITVNSLSITIAALTSLDWKFQSTNDRVFAEQLLKIVEMQEGEQIVITKKGLLEGLAKDVREREEREKEERGFGLGRGLGRKTV